MVALVGLVVAVTVMDAFDGEVTGLDEGFDSSVVEAALALNGGASILQRVHNVDTKRKEEKHTRFVMGFIC